nr:hypothetical protein [Tanacetum cinerariifolium]
MLQGIPTASYGVPPVSAFCHFIEFGDSYKAPPEETGKGPATRTTLLLALLAEHQLRFSKYETAKELWEAILMTFGGNEATKKTKKNQLKQQYGNFKAEEVQKKSESNSQNMAFISSSNISSGKGEVHTASVPTASIQVSTASTDVAAASLSHDNVCAYIASLSNGF